ncbi:MAG: alanine racemase C-terminal domain-containing protein [Rivihabitans pingtungensis]
MMLEADIIGANPAGDEVRYGARFTAPGPMRIGVVACGYADGYRRIVPRARRCGWMRLWPAARWAGGRWICWRWTHHLACRRHWQQGGVVG